MQRLPPCLRALAIIPISPQRQWFVEVETGIEANKLKTEVNVDIKAIKQAKEAISSKLKGESRQLKLKTKQSHPGEGKMVSMFPIQKLI